jgi:hypothetical protein
MTQATGLVVAATGVSERDGSADGLEPAAGTDRPADRGRVYPGAFSHRPTLYEHRGRAPAALRLSPVHGRQRTAVTPARACTLLRARPGIPRSRERVVDPDLPRAYGCEQVLLLTADGASICSNRAMDLTPAWPQVVMVYRRQR